jgi:hypothetical protein
VVQVLVPKILPTEEYLWVTAVEALKARSMILALFQREAK